MLIFVSCVHPGVLYLLSARCDCDDICEYVFKSFPNLLWVLVVSSNYMCVCVCCGVCACWTRISRAIGETFPCPTLSPPGHHVRNPSPGPHNGDICLHLKGAGCQAFSIYHLVLHITQFVMFRRLASFVKWLWQTKNVKRRNCAPDTC